MVGGQAAEGSLVLLIVNADDFGYSRGINRGIAEVHEAGIATSASLMVNRLAAPEAAAYARRNPRLDVGLHVELRPWQTRPRRWSLAWSEQKLQSVVANDVAAQLERFRRLLDRGPTHIDSHHHRHRIDSLRPIFEASARHLDVPLRHFAQGIAGTLVERGSGDRN